MIISYRDQFLDTDDKPPYTTNAILTINVIVWSAMSILGHLRGWDEDTQLLKFGMKVNHLIAQGEYWRLFASMFLHIGGLHLIFNSYALYIYGPAMEKFFGKVKFIIIYIVSGLMGNLLSYLLNPNPSAGASGAIFGLAGALLYLRKERRALFDWAIGPQLLIVIIANLGFGFRNPGIDNLAHVGGLAGGYLAANGLGLRKELKRKVIKKISVWVLILLIFVIGLSYGEVTYSEDVHLNAAYNAIQNNQLNEAKEHIEELSDESRTNPRAKELTEYIYIEDMDDHIQNGQMGEALNLINTLIDYYPEPIYYFYRGYIHEVSGILDKALEDYLYAANTIKDEEEIWYSAARVAYNMERFFEAKTYLEETLKINPDYEDAKEFLDYLEGT